jgi:iron complex outermembrane receptor protein
VINKQLLCSIVIFSILPIAIESGAEAETATSASSTVPSTGEGADLEEIMVTARRTRENLQTVPITINALSAEDIRQKNITEPEDFNTTVPGLTVAPGFLARNSVIYTMRGQGQILGGGGPAVATYFDDVPTYVSGPGYLFDLENVEVLKGPQGTLFGVNSTGGAVLFVPQHPTNNFEGYVDATFGNYAGRRYQAVVNVPLISDVLLVRLAVDDNMRDGYTMNPVNGHQYDDINYQAGRLGVTFKPTDWIENYFLGNFETLNEHGPGLECIAYNPTGGYISSFSGTGPACAAQQANGPRVVNMWIPPQGDYMRTRNYAADDTLTFKLTDDITLKNIFGFRESLFQQSYDIFGLPFPIFEIVGSQYYSAGYGAPEPSQITYSDEIQLHGDSFSHRLHWTSGLFYTRTGPHSPLDRDLADVFGTIQSQASIRHDRSQALYGQGTYDLTDKLSFTLGARYTEDNRRQIANQYIPSLQQCPPPPGQSFPTGTSDYCDIDLSRKFHSPTWNVSLQYQLDPDTMFYLASRRGYKSGGFNNTAPTPATQGFQPEHVTDVELGGKTEFHLGDVKGRVNADVYYSKFAGWQERVIENIVTPLGVQPTAVITNVADGVVEGMDVEATIIPTRHIEISGFYSYTDPYFTSNTFQGVNYVQTPVAGVQKHKASLTARYLFGLPSTTGDASVSATYAWQSSWHGALNLSAAGSVDPDPFHGEVPSYGVLNVRADWKGVLGHPLDLSAYCDNATNRAYLILNDDSYASGADAGQYGPPRIFGLEVRWHFGHY